MIIPAGMDDEIVAVLLILPYENYNRVRRNRPQLDMQFRKRCLQEYFEWQTEGKEPDDAMQDMLEELCMAKHSFFHQFHRR